MQSEAIQNSTLQTMQGVKTDLNTALTRIFGYDIIEVTIKDGKSTRKISEQSGK